MKFFICFLVLVATLSAHAQPQQKACGQAERRLIRSYKATALKETERVITDVQRALTDPHLSWKNWRKLHVAEGILLCAHARMKNLDWVCAKNFSQEEVARTYPVISNKVYLSDRLLNDKDARFPPAVFLHEATHQCGTTDARYFKDGERPGDSNYIGWQMIADTYWYWAENGFCIPGINC
ncbi:MAG: hypothetical protein ACJ76H_13105 [Bacteriovoracaceae bacterium]